MAFQSGTATDHEDLYEKLIAFLTTDAELVSNGQEWEVAWEAPSGAANVTDIVLKGPGLATTDRIYIGLRREDNVLNDASQFFLYGMTGVIPAAEAVNLHINVSTQPVRVMTKATPMDYWFVASGRRFMGIVQVGSVYASFYGGFFLPYGNPLQYSYPLFIGGTAGFGGGTSEPVDWRSNLDGHSAFMYADYASGGTGHNPSAWMLDPNGDWLKCSRNLDQAFNVDSDVFLGPTSFGLGNALGADLAGLANNSDYGYRDILQRMGQTYGEGYSLTPISLVQASPGDQTWGVLDGVYHIPGRGQSVESLIGANDTVHLVMSNTFRTSQLDWFAMALYPEDSNSGLVEDSNSL